VKNYALLITAQSWPSWNIYRECNLRHFPESCILYDATRNTFTKYETDAYRTTL